MAVPVSVFANSVPLDYVAPTFDKVIHKRMADVALNAATSAGATYADIRIGRYSNQYVFTREDRVQNIVNTDSYGEGWIFRIKPSQEADFDSLMDSAAYGEHIG